MTHPTKSAGPAGSAGENAPPTPPTQATQALRRWMMDHLSIRQRLALWYASLLAVTLVLFSVIVYTVAQTQFQTGVTNDLQARARAIASALGQPDTSNQSTPIVPTAPAVTSTPVASPAGTSDASPDASPAATTTETTITPVATANPQTAANIQKQLDIKVPGLLKRLDTQFEVLVPAGQGFALDYPSGSLTATVIPLNSYVIREGLLQGIASTYTARFNNSLLEVYVQPIFNNESDRANDGTPSAQAAATATTPRRPVGVVLVAKPLDDINASLATLARLLVFGDLVAVIFVSLGGWMIAEGSLRPITEVTQTARAIAANAQGRGLGRRVVHHGARDEVGELATTFNGMLDAIERSANAQRRFVADASHELRAPLMTIKGSLELLRRAPDLPEEEQRATLDDAYAESERMAALINDLLLLARVDAASSGSYGLHEAWLDEQLRGRREVIELDRLAMDVFRHGRAQLEASHKSLRLAVTDLEPVSVTGDPGQLRQYALIVLDNAIKYTPAGGTIRIAATRQGDRARLSISDTGIGIDPADWPHIFERFYRADRARERDEHGSGLGLAIAKWIATAHRGEISVTSEPGKGSTFTLLLPALPRGTGQTDAHRALSTTQHRELATAARQAVAPLARLARSVSRPRTGATRKSTGKSTGKTNATTGDARATTASRSSRATQTEQSDQEHPLNRSGIYRVRDGDGGAESPNSDTNAERRAALPAPEAQNVLPATDKIIHTPGQRQSSVRRARPPRQR